MSVRRLHAVGTMEIGKFKILYNWVDELGARGLYRYEYAVSVGGVATSKTGTAKNIIQLRNLVLQEIETNGYRPPLDDT